MGRSSSDWNHGTLTQCDAVRLFRAGAVDSEMSLASPQVINLTDEPGITTASQLDNALVSIFSRYPDVLVRWAHKNEVTSDTLDIDAYAQTVAQMRQVCDQYPNASMGIDLTAWGIRSGAADRFKVCAPSLEFVASSCYNPGRFDSPPSWDPYSLYLDPFLDLAQDWGVTEVDCWEFGNPIDPFNSATRPNYARGMARYLRDGATARGMQLMTCCWWDNMKQEAGSPDDRLQSDNPLTSDAWKFAMVG